MVNKNIKNKIGRFDLWGEFLPFGWPSHSALDQGAFPFGGPDEI